MRISLELLKEFFPAILYEVDVNVRQHPKKYDPWNVLKVFLYFVLFILSLRGGIMWRD